jgi:hypothetical protein
MMDEIPGHPLDLSRLCILPPSQWIVRPCGEGAVVIGAWMDPFTQAMHKRVFKFSPVFNESGKSSDRLAK